MTAYVAFHRSDEEEFPKKGPDADPIPYLLVRPGEGQAGIEARISRSVYYELVALSEPECVGGRQMLGVWSRGCFFPLGDLPVDDE